LSTCSWGPAHRLHPLHLLQSQQLQELSQRNDQLQASYGLATRQLTLQQQLSEHLSQQLQAAETQLQQAQDSQQALLSELRQQQQAHLDLRLQSSAAAAAAAVAASTAAPDSSSEAVQQELALLQVQLTAAEGRADDKERLLQVVTLRWQEAAAQVLELQQTLRRENRHHMRLLR
jgi:methionyl-tRNA formyltransferase